MPWIDDLMAMTKDMESPRQYWYWAGLSAISGAVKNHVWIERKHGGKLLTVYPNLYVILLGPPGIRKGPPVALAQTLLEQLGITRVISGRNSIESIIQALATTKTSAGGGAPVVDSCGSIISDELSTALVRNPDALTILTTLYDGQLHAEWRNTLKHSGVERLKNANLTLLGGINETHFEDLVSEKDLTGGFIGRCVLVVARERATRNSGLRFREGQSVLEPDKLLPYLKEIGKLQGAFAIDDAAIEMYDEWYNNHEPEKSDDRTGAANRLGDLVLKVAELIALSRRPFLCIAEADMRDAMSMCIGTVVTNVRNVTRGMGKSEISHAQRSFLRLVASKPGFRINRSQILKRNIGDLDTYTLDRVVETLLTAKYIEQERGKLADGDYDMFYWLTEVAIKEIFGDAVQ